MLQATNTEYGGLRINVTNVVFVQGSMDPWRTMGITKSSSQSAPAIYIEGWWSQSLSLSLTDTGAFS